MSDPDIIKEMHDLSIIFKNHLAVKIKLSFESKIKYLLKNLCLYPKTNLLREFA